MQATEPSELQRALEASLAIEFAPREPKPPVELRYGFPEVIDNTMRSAFTRCPQSFFRAHINQLRNAGQTSIHLTAGGALARGLEIARRVYYEQAVAVSAAEREGLQALIEAYGDPEDTSTKSGDKSLSNVVRAYESYLIEYPLGKDLMRPVISAEGKAAVEFTGAIPIDVLHPITGNPILYSVRFDMLATYNDAMFCVDEKTTTQLGQRWAGQWDLDSQFTGYVWGGRVYGYPVVGAIIRGIGLLKTKISHAQSIVYRPDWMVDRWYRQLCRDVERMKDCWHEQYFDYAVDKSACDSYSGCPFKLLCESPNPEAWIQTHYENHVWDPLHKDGD